MTRLCLTFVLFFLMCTSARADVINIQVLNFGTWFIPGNNATYDITVNTDGTYAGSPEITMVSMPKKGIYDIGGLNTNSAIQSITVSQNTALSGGGGSFDMDNFQTQTLSPMTDNDGRVTVMLGATAHTSGNGTPYANQTYSGLIDLQFNF